MTNEFDTLFTLRVLHDFYSGGESEDFNVEPLRETQKLLTRHQVVFRYKGSNGKALYKTGDNVPPAAVPIAPKTALEFMMSINNPSLINVTNEVPAPRTSFLFTNESDVTDGDGNTELIRKTVRICGSSIYHTIVSNENVTLTLTGNSGKILAQVSRSAGAAGKEEAFDVQRSSPGLYTVTETSGATSTATLYYADKDVQQAAPFGIIRIVNQPAFPFSYEGNEKYTISFTSTSSTWSYYVVAPNLSPTDIGNLNILDQGRVGDLQIGFDRTSPDADDHIPGMLAKDTTKVVLFRSATALTWQQITRKQIELRKSSTTLIENLPNPDLRKPGTNIYIYV